MLEHKGTKTLETSRLVLRKAKAEDIEPAFRNWTSDPAVTEYLTWPTHESREVTEAVLKHWISQYGNDNFYQWIIVLKELGEAIGTISVVDQSDVARSAEIGYCIGKAWWHRGIMTEALDAVLQFLLEEVGMERIEACHDADNPHSGAVMRKCGMQLEKVEPGAGKNNRGICDICRYVLRPERESCLVNTLYHR